MPETESTTPVQSVDDIEQARFSALFSAVDVAKAVTLADVSIADRMAEVLAAADQAYAWLTADTSASTGSTA